MPSAKPAVDGSKRVRSPELASQSTATLPAIVARVRQPQLKTHLGTPLPSLDGNLNLPATGLGQLKDGRLQEFVRCRLACGSMAHRLARPVTRGELRVTRASGIRFTRDGILDKHADVDWARSKRGRRSEYGNP